MDEDDKADALQEEGECLGEKLQALEDGLQDYGPNVKAARCRRPMSAHR